MADNDLLIKFTPEELDLIAYVLEAESFRDNAWQLYGQDWVNHVPNRINAFTYFYFGINLFPYQLAWYYCPVPEATIHGGRGSGKTEGIAFALAAYMALHPGEDALWVSITKDQAKKGFDAIKRMGASDGRNPRFLERFVADIVSMPFPDIRFKHWDENDSGNVLRVRGIGDESIERLRSYTAGTIVVDEAFRDVAEDSTYAMLRGCIRGPNRYRFKTVLTPAQQLEVDNALYDLTKLEDPEERDIQEQAIWGWLREIGVAQRGFMSLMGNAGDKDWAWARHERARSEPESYWSFVATSWDNPYFGRKERQALERRFQDNPEGLEQEMLAQRPRSLGDVFRRRQIDQCCDLALAQIAANRMLSDQPGYFLGRQPDMGIYQYGVPPTAGHFHVISADPGMGVAPLRNKWVVMVWDVAQLPCELVYFEMGYLYKRSQGDYNGFLARLKWTTMVYPNLPGDIWVESTGPQKGMVQISYPEDLRVNAVSLTGRKLEYINMLVQILGNRMIVFPQIQQMLLELGNYQYRDLELNQDIVMAAICAAAGIWHYHQPPDVGWQGPTEREVAVLPPYDRYARPEPHSGRGRRRGDDSG